MGVYIHPRPSMIGKLCLYSATLDGSIWRPQDICVEDRDSVEFPFCRYGENNLSIFFMCRLSYMGYFAFIINSS